MYYNALRVSSVGFNLAPDSFSYDTNGGWDVIKVVLSAT